MPSHSHRRSDRDTPSGDATSPSDRCGCAAGERFPERPDTPTEAPSGVSRDKVVHIRRHAAELRKRRRSGVVPTFVHRSVPARSWCVHRSIPSPSTGRAQAGSTPPAATPNLARPGSRMATRTTPAVHRAGHRRSPRADRTHVRYDSGAPGVTLRMAVTDDRPTGRPRAVRDGEQPQNADGPNAAFDRQPPQDLTAEQSVLGGMLLSKDAIADVVEVLRPDDFYRPAHQTVYDCILDLYGRGEPADAVTVSAELQRRGELDPARRRAVPAHADRHRADRGERRLLRRDRRGEGDPAPAGRGRHPDRAARLPRRRRAPRSTTSSTAPRPPSTRSPSAPPARTTSRSRSCCSPRWTRSTPSRPAAASRSACRPASPTSTRAPTACTPAR